MDNFIRPKPLCLIVINGLHIDHLYESQANNLKSLINSYPFLTLTSSKNNIKEPSRGYIELGSGNIFNERDDDISLAKIISNAGLEQLHLADTESYPYITYFFNNYNKLKNNQETWQKISSLKVDFNLEGFNSNRSKLTRSLIREINKQFYDFIVVNYNDLLIATNKVETLNSLDKKIKDIIDTILSFNGALLITSNSGLLSDPSVENKVPLFLISKSWKNKSFIDYDFDKKLNEQKINGDISQISPTIIRILGLSRSRKMKSNSLI